MPSLFKQTSVAVLQQRRRTLDREITSLTLFRDKIDRRIAHLRQREAEAETE